MVLKLADEHRNVFVVGDSDQSVYAFRGADIRNILEFEKAFPDTSVVVLDQNYRSTQVILDAANSVISNNLGRKPKDLWTDKSAGDNIVLYRVSGRLVYKNVLRSPCPGLARDSDIVVSEQFGSQKCRGDILRLVDRTSGMTGGICSLGDFVPYRAEKTAG
mgnify:CR=1 FL=1